LITSDQNVESVSLVAGDPKSVLNAINDNDSVSGFAVNDSGRSIVSSVSVSQCSSAIIKSQKLDHYFDSMNKSQIVNF